MLVRSQLGHQAGDELLILAGERLSALLPDGALLARFGGDELAIVWLDAEDSYQVETLVDELNTALRMPFVLSAGSVQISGSIGVVTADVLATSEAQLLRRADIALYAAKAKGRDCAVLFGPELMKERAAPPRRQPSSAEISPVNEVRQVPAGE